MLRGARGRAAAGGLAICVSLTATAIAVAEVAVPPIRLDLQVEGGLRPTKLPRHRAAPAALSLRARWREREEALLPPRVANIVLEVNRQVGIDPGTLPRCRLADLEGTSIPRAERVCGEAEVGRGRAWERLDPPDAEFGSSAQLAAFNARVHGHPGILVHGVFGTPIANTFTMAFELKKSRGAGKNTFPTLLSAEVPAAVQSAGPLTGFELTLSGRHAVNRGYLSASCPAPSGFAGTGATFPLLRLELGFEGGAILSSNLLPSCTPR